jgi:hypothetical protein
MLQVMKRMNVVLKFPKFGKTGRNKTLQMGLISQRLIVFLLNKIKECRTHNMRFGAMSAVPRRQFCGNLNVITPQQVQWKPPLRQAAGTLPASGGDSAVGKEENEI